MSHNHTIRTAFVLGLFLLLLILPASQVFAWVHQGDLLISSQKDVDAIKNDLTEVTGNVIISGEDVKSLGQLLMLEKIGGDLIIKDAPNLKNLDGLSSLKKVEKKVDVRLQHAGPQLIPSRLQSMMSEKAR